MGSANSNRRKIENEIFFRQSNERVAKGFVGLKQTALEEGDKQWADQADEPITFFCECSDENCKKHVKLKPSEYLNLRKNEKQFIIFPGHDTPAIEHKVKSKSGLQVVEKCSIPNKNVIDLKPTDIKNN